MMLPDVIGHENQSQHYQHHRCLCLDLSGRISTPARFSYHTGLIMVFPLKIGLDLATGLNLETENTKKGNPRRPKFIPVHHIKEVTRLGKKDRDENEKSLANCKNRVVHVFLLLVF